MTICFTDLKKQIRTRKNLRKEWYYKKLTKKGEEHNINKEMKSSPTGINNKNKHSATDINNRVKRAPTDIYHVKILFVLDHTIWLQYE